MKKFLKIVFIYCFIPNIGYNQVVDSTSNWYDNLIGCYWMTEAENNRKLSLNDYSGNLEILATIDSITNTCKFVKVLNGKLCERIINSKCYGFKMGDKTIPKEIENILPQVVEDLKTYKFRLVENYPKCGKGYNFEIKYTFLW